MSLEENKAIPRRIYEAFNMRNPDVLDELLSPDFVDHDPSPGQAPGIAGIKDAWSQIFTAYPDIHITIEDILAEGDKVATRVTFWQGISTPTEQHTATLYEMARIIDGKVVDLWNMIKFR